jgi:hypothetical protein
MVHLVVDIKAAEEYIIEAADAEPQIANKIDNKPPCPCSTCDKSRKWERDQIIDALLVHKGKYLEYRGSSFDLEGNLVWAKDDALAYAEGIDAVIKFIEDRSPKVVKRN